ncbi:hypothetical protein HAX54_009618 [Datura stramonium]|uniref:Carbonic anhydrase n=1 Tax=Datura stramonium TaxID=4076 RepID=A0ABS8TGG9_DATST|nr:hypothetical protein [Datura stramonium]
MGVVQILEDKWNSISTPTSSLAYLLNTRINGKKFNLEAHLVHESTVEKHGHWNHLQGGRPDSFLSMVHWFLTVPCTEDVVWTIARKESESNARPAQPLNGRPIQVLPTKRRNKSDQLNSVASLCPILI